MPRGARWALFVGAALAAMAGSGARAEVREINLDGCSAGCGPAAAADDAPASVTLSRTGGRTGDPNNPGPAIVLHRRAVPTALVNGLPSPLASSGAQPPGARGASPYDFFADVIEVSLPAEARAEFAAASLFLFAPSLIGRFTLIDVLSTGNAFFGNILPPSGPAM